MAAAAALVALWAVVAVSAYQAREAVLRQAEQNGANLTAAVADQVSRTFDGIAAMMGAIAERIRASGNAEVYRWAHDMPLISGGVIQAGFIGADGKLVSTTLDPSPEPIDLSDRAHFRVHLDHMIEGIFIGPPVTGRVSHEVTIQVSRRVDSADGRFLGVLVFSLKPASFSGLYRQVDLGPRGIIAITGTDNLVRARFSQASAEGLDGVGQSVAGGSRPSDFGNVAAGTYVRESVIDHVSRIFTYRALERYPLVATVGADSSKSWSICCRTRSSSRRSAVAW